MTVQTGLKYWEQDPALSSPYMRKGTDWSAASLEPPKMICSTPTLKKLGCSPRKLMIGMSPRKLMIGCSPAKLRICGLPRKLSIGCSPRKMSIEAEPKKMAIEGSPAKLKIEGTPAKLKLTGPKKVLMIVGDFVEDYEAMNVYQMLRLFDVKVHVMSPGKEAGDTVRTAVHDFESEQTYSEKPGHDFLITHDLTAVFTQLREYTALYIPGGRSPEHLRLNDNILNIVSWFHKSNRVVAHTCHGIMLCAAAGIINKKKTTCYPACKTEVELAGGQYVEMGADESMIHKKMISAVAWPGNPALVKNLLDSMDVPVVTCKKRILMIVGDFVEDYMAMIPFQMMQMVGLEVHAVCPNKSKGEKVATSIHDFVSNAKCLGEDGKTFVMEDLQTYIETRGHNFALTESWTNVCDNVASYDGLYIPGGRCPEYLRNNEEVCKVVKNLMEDGKPIASIGHGQQLLTAARVLTDRTVTAYYGVIPELKLAKAKISQVPADQAVVDDNLVTAVHWPGHPKMMKQFFKLLRVGGF